MGTITDKHNTAAPVSAENWAAIKETLYLLFVPGMRVSIIAARAEPLEDSSQDLW